MTPSPTSNPDLGELVARLGLVAEWLDRMRKNYPGAGFYLRTARQAADALAALSARAEALEKERDAAHEEIERQNAELEDVRGERDIADGLVAAVLAWGRERDMFARCDYPDGITAEEIAEELTIHEDGCIEQSERRADKAEAEVAGLKARVAEVLAPFAKINNDWLGFTRPDLADDHELNIMGSTVGHFRRAAKLHADLIARTQAEGEGS